jgi:hypothetical protein
MLFNVFFGFWVQGAPIAGFPFPQTLELPSSGRISKEEGLWLRSRYKDHLDAIQLGAIKWLVKEVTKMFHTFSRRLIYISNI